MLVLAALFVGGAGFELGVGIGVRTLYPVVKGLALAAAVLTVQWLTLGALASSGVGGALDMPLARWDSRRISQGTFTALATDDARRQGRCVVGLGERRQGNRHGSAIQLLV